MRFTYEESYPTACAAVYTFHEDAWHLTLFHSGRVPFRRIQHDDKLRTGGGIWFEVARVGLCNAERDVTRTDRAFFGGLPSGEYVLHIILVTLFGTLVANIGYSAGELPTRLAYESAAVPGIFRALMVFMALLVLGSGAMDLAAAIQLTKESAHAQ